MARIEGLVAFQGHHAPDNIQTALTKQWKRKGKYLSRGQSCISTGHASAGVGYQHDARILTSSQAMKTKAFQRAHGQGRVKHCVAVIDKHVSFTLYTAYGYVGGHTRPEQARLKSSLIHAIHSERTTNGGAVIATDLNAGTGDIGYLRCKILSTECWLDVDARASLW